MMLALFVLPSLVPWALPPARARHNTCSTQAAGCEYTRLSVARVQQRMQRQVSGKNLARPDKVGVRVEALVGWVSDA